MIIRSLKRGKGLLQQLLVVNLLYLGDGPSSKGVVEVFYVDFIFIAYYGGVS
jgi:hypothetical protein